MVGSKRVLWSAVLLLLSALVAAVVYRVWPLLNPQATEVAPLDPGCDLRAGPCTARLSGGARITLSIEPREIPVVQPLQLEVAVTGREVRSVEVDFAGVDMNMGFNRPKLEDRGGGRFTGDGILPVCVRRAMEWEARVLAQTDAGLVAAPFRFITVKPGETPPER